MRKTWSRWGMPLGDAPSPANAALISAIAQINRVAAFFIVDFLPGIRMCPLTSLFGRGFRRSGFYPAGCYGDVKGRSRCDEIAENGYHSKSLASARNHM